MNSKICETCGTSFTRNPKIRPGKWKLQRFCSKPCVRPRQKPPSEMSPRTRYRLTKRNGVRKALHRLVAEEMIGRELRPGEQVHHKNGNKLDNRPENLEVLASKDHQLIHHPQIYPSDKACEYCGAIFTPHKTKRKRAKSCSEQCRRKLASQRRRERNQALVKANYVEAKTMEVRDEHGNIN